MNDERELQRIFDGKYAGETLQKIYLELAHVVPKDCISYREIRLGKIADIYGATLSIIERGTDDARATAREALRLVAVAKWNTP